MKFVAFVWSLHQLAIRTSKSESQFACAQDAQQLASFILETNEVIVMCSGTHVELEEVISIQNFTNFSCEANCTVIGGGFEISAAVGV